MDRVAPSGDVYQAGTLSGNPLAMAAGAATLRMLKDSDWYDRLEVMTYVLTTRVKSAFEEHDLYYNVNRLGSMFCVFFTNEEVRCYETVMKCDTQKYAQFYRELLKEGVYLPPAQFEVSFLSCAHDEDDIEKTVAAVNRALERII
jgi:glutamate-1-semialdehyde 2,1-aminomutase